MWTRMHRPVATLHGVKVYQLRAYLMNLHETAEGKIVERKPILDQVGYGFAGSYVYDSKSEVFDIIRQLYSKKLTSQSEKQWADAMNTD